MVLDHMKNCALSRICVLKTALPDQHGSVKLKTTANIRLALLFFPSLLFKDDKPKGFKRRVILSCVQDDSLRFNRLERDSFRSKGGKISLTFRLCTNLNSGFTSHIGELQMKVGKALAVASLPDTCS